VPGWALPHVRADDQRLPLEINRSCVGHPAVVHGLVVDLKPRPSIGGCAGVDSAVGFMRYRDSANQAVRRAAIS
jgi:hypothetical protein